MALPGVRPRAGAAVLALALVAVACSGSDGDPPAASSPTVSSPAGSPSPTASPSPSPSPSPTRSPSPTPSPTQTSPRPSPSPTGLPALTLRRVATVAQPTALASRAGDAGVFIAEKRGRLLRLRGGNTTVVLDIRGRVGSAGSEQGLLGLAFSPDGASLYVNYTDRSGDTRLVEYRYAGGEASSPRELLRVQQPYANHNGGMVAFGPDGLLYTSLGDGGSGGDPQGNAQNTNTLLGTILRLDPRPSGGQPYTIPSDNPFVGRDGRDEIWSYGLRNPWRFSFDRQAGDLWIGDVGQGSWEEINRRPASSEGGENYGWDRLEGRHRYEGSPPANHVLPVHEYARSGGNCAVTGGYVYRGRQIAGLQGWYVYADYCGARILRLRLRSDGSVRVRDLGLQGSLISSFGEGPGGELFVLSLEGPVWKIVAS